MGKAGIAVDNGKVIPNPENIAAKAHAKPSTMVSCSTVHQSCHQWGLCLSLLHPLPDVGQS
jgi:hypothetical protein